MFIGYRNNCGFGLIFGIISINKSMSYEPGTLECRLLIEAKENILNAMKSLSNIKNTDTLHSQLRYLSCRTTGSLETDYIGTIH